MTPSTVISSCASHCDCLRPSSRSLSSPGLVHGLRSCQQVCHEIERWALTLFTCACFRDSLFCGRHDFVQVLTDCIFNVLDAMCVVPHVSCVRRHLSLRIFTGSCCGITSRHKSSRNVRHLLCCCAIRLQQQRVSFGPWVVDRSQCTCGS